MEPARWAQVRTAFDELVTLDPGARAHRLAQLHAEDSELGRWTHALLAADVNANERLKVFDAVLSPDERGLAASVPNSSSTATSPPAPDPFGLRGSLVSHFRLLEVLGAGGMGVVYRAEDVRLGRTVALKFLLPQYSIDPQAKARFLREAQAAGRLDHANLCTVHEAGESEQGHLFLAMSYYAGETLKTRLARERTLPLEQALEIAAQVARGLAYAHDAGVVHRDLKPANLILTPDGTVRILDFGLAKARDLLTLTESGAVMGTFAYMSPEQLLGENVDARADLWSLGMVLVEMLSGRLPPRGSNPVGVISERDLTQDVRECVEQIAQELLRVDPSERYQTAHAVLHDVVAFQRRLSNVTARTGSHDEHSLGARALPGHERRTVVSRRRVSLAGYVAGGAVLAVLGASSLWFVKRERDRRWLVDEAVPRIEKHLDVADWESAYALALESDARVSESRELTELWPRISWRVTLKSEPAGAKVFRQGYGATDGKWEELGQTPLVNIRVPYGLSRLRLEREGYRPLLRALGGGHLNWKELTATDPDVLLVGPETYRMDTETSLPTGMVRVSEWNFVDGRDTLTMRDFFLERYEVTNAQYKRFVEAGGYRQPKLWDSFGETGRIASWEDAMTQFVDRTGRPGPSTWEGGDYPDGEADFPVTGVSWYEAAAYARFEKRELPTAHHWQHALANSMFPWLLPASNFSGKGPRRVTESRSMNQFGAFDMTGNVREWTSTPLGAGRVILGGSWNDPYYIAGTNDTSAPAEDRSAANGIRLALTSDEPAVAARVHAPIAVRTMATAAVQRKPVSDAIYTAYSRVFDYDRAPLNASVEEHDTTRVWIRERIRFDAGYGKERMLLYLYLPKGASTASYQTVLYWPGWDTFWLDNVDEYFAKQIDFIVKSGRAVAFPLYRGIFDRRVDNQRARAPFGTAEYRDNAIYTVKDLRRTVDYLETRADIDHQAIGFFGYSWGGVNGPVAIAQESRIRAGVIQIGFLPQMRDTPEVDPINALPRVRVPLLLFSGEFDPMVPAENARQYFELIATTPEKKRHVVAIGGHFIPRDLLIRETLDWLDKYLGKPGGPPASRPIPRQ